MQDSKNIYRITFGIFLLLIFFAKLTSAMLNLPRVQKSVIVLTGDASENTGEQSKKLGAKPNFNFNEESDRLIISLCTGDASFIIQNLHPEYLLGYIASHFPPVLTPPPPFAA